MIRHFYVIVNFPGQAEIKENDIISDVEANVLVDERAIPLRSILRINAVYLLFR
jgi:hypothetical protein